MSPTENAAELFWEYLQANHKGQGPCLIPKCAAGPAAVCHERDFCECEMQRSFLKGHAEGEIKGRREALEMAQGLVDALSALKCNCIYKPFTHQYFFKCKRCESIAKFEAWRDGK